MSIAIREDIPAIESALAQLMTALKCLTCVDVVLHGRSHLTAQLGECRYYARKDIEALRRVLLGLKWACEGEQTQREIDAAKGGRSD